MPLQIRTSANGAPRALLLTQSAQTAPALIGDLAAWGGQQVIAEARRRFTRFSAARATLSPDDQMMVLSIVGPYEDAATFEQLHSMARQAKDDASRRRFYLALASARDPGRAPSPDSCVEGHGCAVITSQVIAAIHRARKIHSRSATATLNTTPWRIS